MAKSVLFEEVKQPSARKGKSATVSHKNDRRHKRDERKKTWRVFLSSIRIGFVLGAHLNTILGIVRMSEHLGGTTPHP